jgi:DNA-binding transcriptional MerR regulator
MDKLIKIHEVSVQYDITARALKYYEDMGLIKSTKSDDYAYRLYDENAIKRLEQILILRKLNIKIKDIQKIFHTESSEVVLKILGQKVTDIDDEVALLQELKEIVIEFIRQIEQFDFHNDSDVKLLYEKAKEVERQLVNVDYGGNPSNIKRLVDVTEKLEKRPDVRIIQLPNCRMITSGNGDKATLKRFDKLWSGLDAKRKDRFFPRDFMWWDEERNASIWWYAIEDWVTETDTKGFEIFDFEGGFYAAAICRQDDYIDGTRVYEGIKAWVSEHDAFELDERLGRRHLWHVVGSQYTDKGLGYRQLEIFVPMKLLGTGSKLTFPDQYQQ